MVEDENKRGSKKKNVTDMHLKSLPSHSDPADLIGQRLRRFYDEVAEQPVPDRFLDLLSKLEVAAPSKKPKSN